MDKQLFIPDKIAVGFQKREGTYTQKLAYVIYYDQKGVLRKEKSWNSWRDHKIKSVEFDNTPTDGFVLNKGVGGQRQSYGWNARNEYIRVYDPRDFEFEISVANLLFILRECDCSRGKGLEGKFVYAWDGTELVLLPEISSDYKNSKNYTQLQAQGVKSKELIAGASYITKKQETLIYLGRFDYHHITGKYWNDKGGKSAVCKKYVFWTDKPESFGYSSCTGHPRNLILLNDLKSIAALSNSIPVANYAELVQKYAKSENGSKIVKLFTKSFTPVQNPKHYHNNNWVSMNADGTYTEWETCYAWQDKTKIEYIRSKMNVDFKDGTLKLECNSATAYPPGAVKPQRNCWYGSSQERYGDWVEPTNLHLYAELESGAKVRIAGGNFYHSGDY